MRGVRIRIRSTDLPGRSCGGSWEDVHIGIQLGREAAELVPADRPSAEWVVEVERTPGGDFRGPAVHGRKGERFVYLVWRAGATGPMLGRVKVMLDEHADLTGERATATVSLTDDKGRPRCARLRPPAISWTKD